MRDTDGLKDTLRIKDKILQDQQDSIGKLKEQLAGLQAQVAFRARAPADASGDAACHVDADTC